MARISLDAVRQLVFTEIRNIHAAAGRVIAPAVITAAHDVSVHDALRQWHLPMRAAVFQRENSTILGADEHDRLAGETCGERPSGLHLARPGDGIPMVGMRTDLAEVKAGQLRRRRLLKHSRAPRRDMRPAVLRNAAGAKVEESKALRHPSSAGSGARATRLELASGCRRTQSAPPGHPAQVRSVVEAGLLARGHRPSPSSQDPIIPVTPNGLEAHRLQLRGQRRFHSRTANVRSPPASLLASRELSSPKTTTASNMGEWIDESRSLPHAAPLGEQALDDSIHPTGIKQKIVLRRGGDNCQTMPDETIEGSAPPKCRDRRAGIRPCVVYLFQQDNNPVLRRTL